MMTKAVVLYKPSYTPPLPLPRFLFGEIFFLLITSLFFWPAWILFTIIPASLPFAVISYAIGVIMVYLLLYTIIRRINSQKYTIHFDEGGLHIVTPTTKTSYRWNQLKSPFLSSIVYSPLRREKLGYFYLFFSVVNAADTPQEITDAKQKETLYFIGKKESFAHFLGHSLPFDFALCLGDTSDSDSELLMKYISNIQQDFPKHVRPLIEVQTAEEFNTIVKNMFIESVATQYLLPEVSSIRDRS